LVRETTARQPFSRPPHPTTTWEDILEDTCAVGCAQYCDAGDAGLEDTPKREVRARREGKAPVRP
jgi:hypothetical protein